MDSGELYRRNSALVLFPLSSAEAGAGGVGSVAPLHYCT